MESWFNKLRLFFTRKKPKEGYPYLNGRSLIVCTVWIESYAYSVPSLYDETKDLFLIDSSIFCIDNSKKITYWEYIKSISDKPQKLSRKDQRRFFDLKNIEEFRYDL